MADAATLTPPPVTGPPTLESEEQSLITQNQADRTALSSQRTSEEAPLQDAINRDASNVERMAQTPAQSVPLPENAAKHIDPKQMSEAASVFMTLGALGGLLTKRPMTAALNNMTAAMKGVQEGDAEQYDRAYKEFQTNYDKAIKTNRAMLDEKDKALKDTNLSLTARIEQLRQIDAKYGNIGKDMQGSFDSRMKFYDSQRKAQTHAEDQKQKMDQFNATMQEHRDALALHHQEHEDSLALRRQLATAQNGSNNPEDRQALVDAIATGRLSPSTLSTKGGHREQIMGEVASQYPDYDQKNFTSQTAVMKDFTAGATAKNVTAINTAIGHIGTMSELAKAMQNGDVKLINSLSNRLATEMGDPSINNFETARDAVGSELMRVFRGTGASEHETAEWRSRFDKANSPEQLSGAVKTAGELMGSRIRAVNDQWKRGMSTDKGFPGLLSPSSAAALKTLGVDPGLGGGAGNPKTATNPKTGEKLQLVNGQWVPLK